MMLHMHNTDIDLDTIEDLNKFANYITNQLGHAWSKSPWSNPTVVIQRKVHFLYAKNLPAELPGYGLVHNMVNL